MSFVKRTEKGSLSIRTLDFQILLDEMFDVAKSEEEVEWILENLQSMIELASEERIEMLDSQE